MGFTKVDQISDVKQFAVRGDFVQFWLPLCENPHSISFFGEEIESIQIKKLQTELQNPKKQDQTEFTKFSNNSSSDLFEVVKKSASWADFFIVLQNQIINGDYVVHEDHGVARYAGIVEKNKLNYLELEYSGQDRLYIPISQIQRITKYIGASGVAPKVTKLNGGEWQRIKKKVKESVVLLARELLIQLAKREVSDSPKISPITSIYDDFCNDFEFELTIDQQRAIDEISRDLHGIKAMNRLLVGDVGFGKTEVAMRAVFQVVESGFQVSVLCPTTILAAQHYKLFKDRFEKFGINVGLLCSFNSTSENKMNVDKLKNGKLDIIIGTHRLLSNDVSFAKLGMIIIDEEQKFGVKQKEKLKATKYGVHVLSMSATPIPRSLSLALSKLQEISVITTPPPGRKAVITTAQKLDWNILTAAIEKEISRGGQCYFVHNEIKTIYVIRKKLEELLPKVRFAVAYSHTEFDKKNSPTKLFANSSSLEKTITAFYEKQYDCLITTTIIENGIDMPNVNTIIINKAQNLGLSQLHQLRGRVGRSKLQSYCYLFFDGETKITKPELTDEPILKIKKKIKKSDTRIEAIVEASHLGAGFQIASRDLEIRGSGNILGKEQSGNINLIGYGMYIKLLEEEISKLS